MNVGDRFRINYDRIIVHAWQRGDHADVEFRKNQEELYKDAVYIVYEVYETFCGHFILSFYDSSKVLWDGELKYIESEYAVKEK